MSWFQTKLQDSPQVSENELVSPQGPQCKEGDTSCIILMLLIWIVGTYVVFKDYNGQHKII
jgi:hypothetical protein